MSVYQSSSLALSILLACCAVIPDCVGAQSTVFILPGASTPCPGQGPCYLIDQYVSDSSLRNGITDIILQFQPGDHNLSVPFTVDTQNTPSDSGIASITMRGTRPGFVSATLLCTEDFTFNFMDSVRISGINLVNCGGPSTHIRNVMNFTLEDSTFQSDMPFRLFIVTYPIIVNSVFSDCTNGALTIESSRPMIRNCTFSNNVNQQMRSGNSGAINGVSVNAFIDQCTFKNNRATFTGGAIYFTRGTSFIMNSYFFNNSVSESQGDGGAIYSIGGSLTIEDSNFTSNIGQSNGGAVTFFGEDITFVVRRSVFMSNTAGFEGGAVRVSHTNSDISRLLSTTIDDSRFVGNSAPRGGAVMYRGSNLRFVSFGSSFVNNTSNDGDLGSGALYVLSSRAQVVVTQATFTRNRGIDGAMGVTGRNYSVTVGDSSFVENIGTRSGGAIVSLSSGVGNIYITGSEFNRNSAPQCGALNLNADNMNPNIQTRGAQTVTIFASNFANNRATVGSGGALCASDISISISGTPVSTFTQNSAVTGGGAISTDNSVLTISEEAFFSGNSARSGGDAIHACSSEVTVELSDGLLGGSMDGQCLLYNNNGTFPNNGGVSSHSAINLLLFSFMTVTLVVLMNTF